MFWANRLSASKSAFLIFSPYRSVPGSAALYLRSARVVPKSRNSQFGWPRRPVLRISRCSIFCVSVRSDCAAGAINSVIFAYGGSYDRNRRSMSDEVVSKGVQMSTGGLPRANLWRRSLRLFGLFRLALVGLLISGWQDFRNASGGERAEITFILIGGTSALAFAIIFAFFLDYLIGQSRALLFAPFRVVVFSLVVWLRDRHSERSLRLVSSCGGGSPTFLLGGAILSRSTCLSGGSAFHFSFRYLAMMAAAWRMSSPRSLSPSRWRRRVASPNRWPIGFS